MTKRANPTASCLILLAFVTAVITTTPVNAQWQEGEHFSHKQLQALIKNASSAKDYQRLATYFHYRELEFRTKAQGTLDEYASHNGKFPMATKTVSRADAANRAYHGYLSKADENATLAARYDEMLAEMGLKPEVISATTISAKNPANSSESTPGSTLLAKPRSSGN